ncbi:MAG: hypothetical protein AB7E24_25755 [Novosphingobium sp.]
MRIVVIAPPLTRRVVESALRPVGHEVSFWDEEPSLMSLLSDPAPDLVVLGEMDGNRQRLVEMSSAIRASSRWTNTAIYLLCAEDADGSGLAQQGHSVDKWFGAPFSPLELLDAVTEGGRFDD